MNDFTITGFRPDAASSATSAGYSTTRIAPTPQLDPGWHGHSHRPHAQHHAIVASPRFEAETLEPALPIEWIILLPLAVIVAGHLKIRRSSRFVAARSVV